MSERSDHDVTLRWSWQVFAWALSLLLAVVGAWADFRVRMQRTEDRLHAIEVAVIEARKAQQENTTRLERHDALMEERLRQVEIENAGQQKGGRK